MRIGIFVTLAVFAVACDKNKTSTESSVASIDQSAPSSINETLAGICRPTNPNSNSVQSKWAFELDATQSGEPPAKVIADATFRTHKKKDTPVDSRCPAEYKWGTNLVSLKFSQTYADGSSFEGKAKNPEGSAVCTDGRTFYINVADGEITKGKGKFKKVKGGDWNANITVGRICDPDDNTCPADGEFNANFQY